MYENEEMEMKKKMKKSTKYGFQQKFSYFLKWIIFYAKIKILTILYCVWIYLIWMYLNWMSPSVMYLVSYP